MAADSGAGEMNIEVNGETIEAEAGNTWAEGTNSETDEGDIGAEAADAWAEEADTGADGADIGAEAADVWAEGTDAGAGEADTESKGMDTGFRGAETSGLIMESELSYSEAVSENAEFPAGSEAEEKGIGEGVSDRSQDAGEVRHQNAGSEKNGRSTQDYAYSSGGVLISRNGLPPRSKRVRMSRSNPAGNHFMPVRESIIYGENSAARTEEEYGVGGKQAGAAAKIPDRMTSERPAVDTDNTENAVFQRTGGFPPLREPQFTRAGVLNPQQNQAEPYCANQRADMRRQPASPVPAMQWTQPGGPSAPAAFSVRRQMRRGAWNRNKPAVDSAGYAALQPRPFRSVRRQTALRVAGGKSFADRSGAGRDGLHSSGVSNRRPSASPRPAHGSAGGNATRR